VHRIGLIGGMSWTSTMDYYRLLNRATQQRHGGEHSTDLALRSLDFQSLLDTVDQPGAVEASLGAAADDVAAAGARVLAVAAVTAHRFTGPLEQRRDLQFVHIGDATSRALTQNGVRRTGVIGTSTTLRDTTVVARVAGGTQPLLPPIHRYPELDRVIFGELIRGQLSDPTRQLLANVVDELRASGADAVLLACTELSAVHADLHTSLPIFDATTLHCMAILDAAQPP
jgi:aspartate racemase